MLAVDYSKIMFSQDPNFLIEIGEELGEIGMRIEEYFEDKAQDIEGAIIKDGDKFRIYIVQTRDQIN